MWCTGKWHQAVARMKLRRHWLSCEVVAGLCFARATIAFTLISLLRRFAGYGKVAYSGTGDQPQLNCIELQQTNPNSDLAACFSDLVIISTF
jgi:hypothetical protein